jgi:hypothetical protein
MTLLGMKNYNYYGCGLLIVALACATLSGCGTSATRASRTASASTVSMPRRGTGGDGFNAYSELQVKHVPHWP